MAGDGTVKIMKDCDDNGAKNNIPPSTEEKYFAPARPLTFFCALYIHFLKFVWLFSVSQCNLMAPCLFHVPPASAALTLPGVRLRVHPCNPQSQIPSKLADLFRPHTQSGYIEQAVKLTTIAV